MHNLIGKLILNKTEVHLDEIREIISNKNVQKGLLFKDYESG